MMTHKESPKPGEWWRSQTSLVRIVKKENGIVWVEVHSKYEIKLYDFGIVYFLCAFAPDDKLNNEQIIKDIIE